MRIYIALWGGISMTAIIMTAIITAGVVVTVLGLAYLAAKYVD